MDVIYSVLITAGIEYHKTDGYSLIGSQSITSTRGCDGLGHTGGEGGVSGASYYGGVWKATGRLCLLDRAEWDDGPSIGTRCDTSGKSPSDG